MEDGDNCGKCEKCVRTLLGIAALGALDKYAEVFDIDYYRKHKKWYLQQMLIQMAHNKHDYFEMYPYFKSEITLDMRFKVLPYTIENTIRKLIPRDSWLFNLLKKVKRILKS